MQIISMSSQDVSDLVKSVVLETIQNLKSNLHLLTEISKPDDEIRFTITELAAYLKCSKVTIHAYKNRGVFVYYQTGKTVYFKKSEVDAALASKKKGAKHA